MREESWGCPELEGIDLTTYTLKEKRKKVLNKKAVHFQTENISKTN